MRAMATAEMAGDGRNQPATGKATGESRERVRERERERSGSVGLTEPNRFGPG